MNKNVEFLYKVLNEFFTSKGVSPDISSDIRRVLGDLVNFGDTDKERYVNITALSNAYCLVLAKSNTSIFIPNANYTGSSETLYSSQFSLTYLCKNLLETNSYVPMYLKLALEDILNFLWNPKVLRDECNYESVNVSSSSLDLYLNAAVDDYVKYRESINKNYYNEASEVKTDSLKLRKDSNGEVMILESSLEFTLLLNKFNIEYIISLLIILSIAMLTSLRARV